MMMMTVTVSTLLEAGIGAWIVMAGLTALYGWQWGYPFFPIFLAALFPPGFPVVLLVITIAVGRDPVKGKAPPGRAVAKAAGPLAHRMGELE
jgi:hypothetical protein